MKISKTDALNWYRFFSELPPEEELSISQQEISLSVLSQIEVAEEARQKALMKSIPRLKSLCGRTLYVGDDSKFPRGCKSCLLGSGLSAVRKTNHCNMNCPFCYDYGQLNHIPPIGEGLWEIGGTRFREDDLPLLFQIDKKPTGIAYVYLEPFMEIEKYSGVISRFASAGIYQHMYTNGTLATEENLRMLGQNGLNELRFNLGASGCSDRVIEKMATAKKYIPMVGIETPMTPELYEKLLQKKQKILDTGIDFINLAELHLNQNNIENYANEPMYMYRMGYLSPIWSRELTLKLMKQADEENWPVCVHDCSDQTKFARDLNLKAKEGSWFGASAWGCEFDTIPYAAFLPVLEDDNFQFVEEEPMPKEYYGVDSLL